VAEEKATYTADGVREIPRDELVRLIKDLESQMKTASKSLEFERAALLRDQIVELRRDLQGDSLTLDPRKLIDGVPQAARRSSRRRQHGHDQPCPRRCRHGPPRRSRQAGTAVSVTTLHTSANSCRVTA